MKDKEKKGFIVPYGFNVGGNLLGDPTSHYSGMPLYLSDEPDEEPDEL